MTTFTEIVAPLKQAVNQAPQVPGCYQWKDAKGTVLYIGKAVNLRNRLRNYVTGQPADRKTYNLMCRARSVEWIVTDTEKEALILEANLVKKIQPPFNVRLKDDKRYPYVCVSLSEPFPQIFISRQVRDDGNAYFGPYTDVRATRNMIALIHKIFPVRKVRQRLPLKKPKRPCMNYHIKRCLAPCTGEVPEDEYRKVIDEIILFLEGKREILENLIIGRMQEYSEAQEYEMAAAYRDMLKNIRTATESQSVIQAGAADEDVIAFARRDDHGQLVVIEIRGGRMLGRKSFPLMGLSESSEAEVLESFVRDYYLQAPVLPSRIVPPSNVPAARRRVLEDVLKDRAERRVRIAASRAPQMRPLIKLAQKNAELLLSERLLATRLRDRETALEDLRKMFGLEAAPAVLECYDISHFQGAETVASGVMFVDGAPHKAGYRHYRIKSLDEGGIDDPASIREAVGRRIQRLLNENRALPDLMVIDGGATQLAAACEAATALGAGELPIVSLAKQREEIYLPGDVDPRAFDPNRPGMRLLRQIRDEAHRFAITHHRSRRNKQTLRHILDDVEDIGPARKKALLRHFEDRKIEEVSAEELVEVPGIGPELAKKIRGFLDGKV